MKNKEVSKQIEDKVFFFPLHNAECLAEILLITLRMPSPQLSMVVGESGYDVDAFHQQGLAKWSGLGQDE